MIEVREFESPEIISYVSCETFTIDTAPVGILILEDNTLICKIGNKNGVCECYVISSGKLYCENIGVACKSVLLNIKGRYPK